MFQKVYKKAILFSVFTLTFIFLANYGRRVNGFYGDALGYYLYLPSTFIYHNVTAPYKTDYRLLPAGIPGYLNDIKESKTVGGNGIDQYTYGVALLEAPFFFIAHIYEIMEGLPANGYSPAYYNLIKVSSIFYGLLGLLLLYKILKIFFSPQVSLLTTVAIYSGTNLFWFSICQAGMSHVPLFFLYTLLIFFVIKLHERPRAIFFVISGAVAGLITVIRPTDLLCLLIPCLYNVYSKETIRQKIVFLKENVVHLFLFAFAFVLPVIPQLLYWKAVEDTYIYYSYGDQGFNWLHPKLMEGLFYFSNGWLAYSPIMIFSLLGLLFYRRVIQWKWVAFFMVPLYIYIIYSWYCYNYINGLGSRPMIHMYPLLALFLAAFINVLARQRPVVKYAFALVFFFLIAVNICYSVQQLEGVICSEQSNAAFTVPMLFRTHLKYNDLVAWDLAERQPDSSKLTKLCTLACNNYDDSVSGHFVRDTIFGGKYKYHIQNDERTVIVDLEYDAQKFKGAKWIKCSGKFMYLVRPDYNKHLFVFEITDKIWKGCKIENKIAYRTIDTGKQRITLEYCEPERWGYVSYYTKVPRHIKDGSRVKLYIWSIAKTDLYMDDVCLELYK
jgi:hypothetical protein